MEPILVPILFNFCVANILGTVNNCKCLQYVNDSTIHQLIKNLKKSIKQTGNHLETDQTHLMKWSKERNLVFNSSKTKLMIVGAKTMTRVHD